MTLSEYIASLRGKTISVIGIGVSNTPLIQLLLEQGCTVTARDKSSREMLGETATVLEEMGAHLQLGETYLQELDEDIIFRTPGMHPQAPELLAAAEKGSEITSEMEVFFKVCPCKIIAVTGSDGKTTTTSIIAELLEKSGFSVHVGGNIGTPLLCQAEAMKPNDMAVIELSSFQLMTMKQSPNIAVITNLAPNHLDVHQDMTEYVNAKRNIYLHQNKHDTLILNYDNDITRAFSKDAVGFIRYFSRRDTLKEGIFLTDGIIWEARQGEMAEIMNASDILIPGDHNIENFMAAFAAVSGMVTNQVMTQVAMEFKGVAHRIELVRTYKGVKYYNDSIASSPTRTIAGLRSFQQKVILIAGGKDKGVPFDELGPEILKHVKTLVLTGPTSDSIRQAVERVPGYKDDLDIIEKVDFRDAVLAASHAASAGDIVMLSPACTSFDRFKNFAQRGDTFINIVNGLE